MTYFDCVAPGSTIVRGLGGQHANVFHVNNQDKVIAFHGWEQGGPGDDVVVVANMADQAYDHYTIGFPQRASACLS